MTWGLHWEPQAGRGCCMQSRILGGGVRDSPAMNPGWATLWFGWFCLPLCVMAAALCLSICPSIHLGKYFWALVPQAWGHERAGAGHWRGAVWGGGQTGNKWMKQECCRLSWPEKWAGGRDRESAPWIGDRQSAPRTAVLWWHRDRGQPAQQGPQEKTA